ncbi:MAG TPA: multicopper oxidase domain-containing protein [Nocardioides sp.]|uniref:multicopper oxidase domain-containing protein n=1 Tax=Nocardioides sp. TaxID=35761 RepID=UPI002D80335F|nr:multicopper oxidase domain-containing protein [Nocardioides sp.]HET6652063.1 multicopper oxidase domain-containing protein [Nocardioides sp.]
MTRATRGFWPLRDLPVVFWLLAAVTTAVLHPFVPAPRWLTIHLLLLGAVTHAVLVWSRYFADALLHCPELPSDRRLQSRRLLFLNAGVLVVVAGVLTGWWPVTVAGASAVASAVVWHGVDLVRRMRRSLPARFGATVRFYVAACCCLPVGALLGTLLARGLDDPLHARLILAHAVVNVLGWMGLTVVGTLVTLWPTMLRTRVADGAERSARRALPVLVVAVSVAAVGAAAGTRPVAAAGLAGYLVGLALVAGSFLATARLKPPSSFPTWSVLAAMGWLAGCVLALAVSMGMAASWAEAADRFTWVTPYLAAGFGAQVLLGALSYLVPMALGGGPSPVRAANAALDRGGALRVVTVNAGLLVCALPVPATVRVVVSVLVLGGLASFLPLLVVAIRASRRARVGPGVGATPRTGPPPGRPQGQVSGLAVTGLATVALAVAVGVALDPAALAGGRVGVAASAGIEATGRTTTVRVEAADMRFVPARIAVPAGDRLVIELRNADDTDVHDLVLDTGDDTGRLSPGESAVLDVGVVGRDLDGWCSVLGHRQMGMVLRVEATGAAAQSRTGARSAEEPVGDHAGHAHGPQQRRTDPGPPTRPDEHGGSSAAIGLDFMAAPGTSFTAHDAALPALEDRRVHRRTLTVTELEREVAPGVSARLWTYAGTAPGPVLHGEVGDTFVITLVNDGTVGHSIDFHAGALAPERPMRTVPPGESLVYRFTATMAGIWMYHCSTMPMSGHIASGLFGAVVIEPPGLPDVDRSYVLTQSELYLGEPGGPVDMGKLRSETPDAVVFNGYANQYDHRPLRARVGERVRIWLLDAGPNRGTSFHVVGAQFDTTYAEGAYLLRHGPGGAQSLSLAPAQGGFVELAFPEAGRYPFVSHVMLDAERGAHGIFDVR